MPTCGPGRIFGHEGVGIVDADAEALEIRSVILPSGKYKWVAQESLCDDAPP